MIKQILAVSGILSFMAASLDYFYGIPVSDSALVGVASLVVGFGVFE